MNISTLQEQTMRELIQRLYAPTDDSGRRRIEAALLRANSSLADFTNLPKGAPLLVPPVEGAPRAQGESNKNPQAKRADQVQGELESYRGELKEAILKEMEAVKRQLELIDSDRIKGLVGEDQNLRELREVLQESLKQTIGELERRIEILQLK
jgi:hypothetical protein